MNVNKFSSLVNEKTTNFWPEQVFYFVRSKDLQLATKMEFILTSAAYHISSLYRFFHFLLILTSSHSIPQCSLLLVPFFSSSKNSFLN